MPRTLKELLEEAGGDAESVVKTARDRWRQQVREIIRSFTGLKLSHRRGTEREQVQVPIHIKAGLPDPLRGLEDEELTSDEQWAIEHIGLWSNDIAQFCSTAADLQNLAHRLLAVVGWEGRAQRYRDVLQQAKQVGEELQHYAARATLLKRIVGIHHDVLGVYRYAQSSEIDLYWLVIGATARLLGVDREGLTVVVLAHELAHAYTHLGMDIDGKRWDSGFSACHLYIVEGLAQFYTEIAMQRLNEDGYDNGWKAYQALLKHQSGPYRAHVEWVERYTPEVMRAALLAVRNLTGRPDMKWFSETLDEAANHLQRDSPQRRLPL